MLGFKQMIFLSLAILVVDVHGMRKKAANDVTVQAEKAAAGERLVDDASDAAFDGMETIEDGPEVLEPRDSTEDIPVPLCWNPLVKKVCSKLTNGDPKMSAPDLLQDLFSASRKSVKAFVAELNGKGRRSMTHCRSLCKRSLKYAVRQQLIVPDGHDKGCIKSSGKWVCEVDLSPKHIADEERVDLESPTQPDHGVDEAADESSSVLEGAARGIVARRTTVASKPKEGASQSAFMAIGAGASDGDVEQSPEQMALKTLRLFRIYVSHPDDDEKIINGEDSSSLLSLNGTSATMSSTTAIATAQVQARAWVSTVLGEMASFSTGTLRSKWFGGSGTKSTTEVRTRILNTFNFMDSQLADMNYLYPADDATGTSCGGSTLAYVWKWTSNEEGYEETKGPVCSSFSQAKTKNCAVDSAGHYIVYLCKYWYESFGEVARTSTFVHEAAHHTGPSDVSYDVSTIKSMSQEQQLNNAANYQRFGEDLTLTAWDCADKDAVSGLPYTCSGGPCSCGPFKDMCDHATHGATIREQCKATCDLCQAPTGSSTPPRRRRISTTPPRRRRATPSPTPSPTPPRRRRAATTSCADSTTYKDPVHNDDCPGWVGYSCSLNSAANTAELKAQCPVACKICTPPAPAGSTTHGCVTASGEGQCQLQTACSVQTKVRFTCALKTGGTSTYTMSLPKNYNWDGSDTCSNCYPISDVFNA